MINGTAEIKRSKIQQSAKWLFNADILPAFCKALQNIPVLKNVFNDSIFPYHRHDIPIDKFPALCVYHGDKYSPAQAGGYDTITMHIDIIMPINDTREQAIYDLEAIRSILQNVVKNIRYGVNIFDSINVWDRTQEYMFGFSSLSEEDKAIIDRSNIMGLVGHNYRSNKPYLDGSDKGSKFRVCENSFDYQYSTGSYYRMMEELGVDALNDPQKIVYQEWDSFIIDNENERQKHNG